MPMRVFSPVKEMKQGERLLEAYKKVRCDGIPPDMTGNIDFMVYPEKYEAVMTNALMENAKEDYNLILRPWQKKVLNLLVDQGDRRVLWVWDYDGNSGKSELCKFLMMKRGFQLLSPGRTHDLCGLIKPFAKGFVFDCSRNSFSGSSIGRINAMYEVLEDLKNKFLITGKYKGCEKIIQHNTVIVFANQLPNLDRLSLDRWDFFHTKLG
jgi:hypothetical protein